MSKDSSIQISSLKHPLVKYWIGLQTDRKARYGAQSVLLEGTNAIFDFLSHKRAKRLIIEEGKSLNESLNADEIVFVPRHIIEKISALESPEGIIAEVTMPPMTSLDTCRFIVACDHLQDPGNLGTIIRSALALGWEGIFLIAPCADPWNPKTVRASKGATFSLPIAQGSYDDLSRLAKKQGHTLLVADFGGRVPQHYVGLEKVILILGNEAHGVSLPESFSAQTVTIPMEKSMESLNVASAAAILFYLLKPHA